MPAQTERKRSRSEVKRGHRDGKDRQPGLPLVGLLEDLTQVERAGLSLGEIRELIEAGSAPASDRLQAIAIKKLPEVESLIARAEAMRDWLRTARGCGCQTIDECALFWETSDRSVQLPKVVSSSS